jgi:hypothetical protein
MIPFLINGLWSDPAAVLPAPRRAAFDMDNIERYKYTLYLLLRQTSSDAIVIG